MKIGAREARNAGSVGFTVSSVEATANLRGPRIEIWAFWGKTRPLVWLGQAGESGVGGFRSLVVGFWWWVGFWGKTYAGVGVAAPRHNCTRGLTIDKVLGFGHDEPISYCGIFLSAFIHLIRG